MAKNKDVNLDFKGFKHIKSDDHSTTLQHEKHGHTITLIHKALSPNNQKQLQALSKIAKDAQTDDQHHEERAQKMADGGEAVNKQGTPNTGVSYNPQQEREKKTAVVKHIVGAKASDPTTWWAEGGEVHEYADGTPNGPIADDQAFKMPETDILKMPVPSAQDVNQAKMRDYYNQSVSGELPNRDQYLFHGNEAPSKIDQNAVLKAQKSVISDEKFQADKEKAAVNDTANLNQSRTALGLAPINVPEGLQTGGADQQVGAPAVMPQPQQNQQQPQLGTSGNSNDPYSMLQQGYQSQLAGINQASKAQQQEAQLREKALVEQQKAQETALDQYHASYLDLMKEREGIIHDIQNGHIDPEKYWTGDKNGNGGHSKLMTGIGLILAGFNPTNNPNAALNFLKFQMEQNLNAQEKNLNSSQNLLAHNMQMFGNLRQAKEFTRMQQNDMVANQLQQAAATAATPMAKAMALQAAGKLQEENAPKFQQFAMQRAMMNMANGQGGPNTEAGLSHMIAGMRVLNPAMAKEWESRIVPGIGVSQINPVPEKVREQLVAGKDLEHTAQDLMQFINKNPTINPLSEAATVGAQKTKILQSKVRESLLGTVYREGEQPLLDQFVSSNPTNAFMLWKNNAKLRTLLDANKSHMKTLMQGAGITPFGGSQGEASQQGYRPKSFKPAGQ